MIRRYAAKLHRAKQKGQAMTEFALVISIVLFLMFGLIEAGRLLFMMSSVYAGAREGARIGSAEENYNKCEVIKDAAIRAGLLLGNNPINVTYDNGKNTTSIGTCGDSGLKFPLGTRVVVHVEAEYSPLVPIPFIQPFTIDSTARRTIMKGISRVNKLPTPEPSPTSPSFHCSLLSVPNNYPKFQKNPLDTYTIVFHNNDPDFAGNLQKVIISGQVSSVNPIKVEVNGNTVWTGTSYPSGGISVAASVAPDNDMEVVITFDGDPKNATKVKFIFNSTCEKSY